MTAAAILARLDALGVVVVARGERLALRPAAAAAGGAEGGGGGHMMGHMPGNTRSATRARESMRCLRTTAETTEREHAMADDMTRHAMGLARSQAYRERRRRGALCVVVEIERDELHALERLGVLPVGERDLAAVGAAVARFMGTADAVARMGEALYPRPAV